jgi:hypothetical protein
MRNVANQKKTRHGVLSLETVRAAMFEIGWRAYTYVAGCLAQLACYFMAAQQCHLTQAEKQWFKQVYYPQPHYGNLPLILVLERGIAGLAGARLLEHPDDERMIGVLHRLLEYDAEMVHRRKAADRRSRAPRSSARTRQLRHDPADKVQRADRRVFEDPDRLDAIAPYLAKVKGAWCMLCNFAMEYSVVDDSNDVLTIQQRCFCGQAAEFDVSHQEFIDVAEQLAGRERESDSNKAQSRGKNVSAVKSKRQS